MYVVFCFLVFGCQYQCNRLPGETCLRNDLLSLRVEYKLTHSLTYYIAKLSHFNVRLLTRFIPARRFAIGAYFPKVRLRTDKH